MIGGYDTQTPVGLLSMIERARHYVMSPAEKRAQRVSFVYGQLGGRVPKDRIISILDGDGGTSC